MKKRMEKCFWVGITLSIIFSLFPVLCKEYNLLPAVGIYGILILGNLIAGGLIIYGFNSKYY